MMGDLAAALILAFGFLIGYVFHTFIDFVRGKLK